MSSTSAVPTSRVDRFTSGPDLTVAGTAAPPLGGRVCMASGYIAGGWQCGRVVATNQTVCYIPGCVGGLLRTSLCLEPGAVGAPVVTDPGTGTTALAVGLVTDDDGHGCGQGGTTYVQPITPALAAYGAVLVTG